MTLDEMKQKARIRVEADNPTGADFQVTRVWENILDGTLISVTFKATSGKEDSNHVHFARGGETRVYRWHSDIIQAVSGSRERIWFFRFIELAGVGGVIAFFLVLVFSALLCVLAFKNPENSSILEVVKLSFSIILGFFFGSQSTKKPA